MTVKVGKRAILEGTPGSAETCPIAYAIVEQLEKAGETNVSVNVDCDYITIVSTRVFKTTKAAAKFIEAFDDGKKVKPITVTLR